MQPNVAEAIFGAPQQSGIIDDKLPPFPELTGPIDDLIRGITADLPYEHKALCALTYVGLAMSGRVRLASDPHLQPRFYGCMVGNIGTGKSASEKEVRRELAPIFKDIQFEFSIDSGPALIEAVSEYPRLMHTPDELADAFEKARQTPGAHNSLFGEFLRLYESNTTARRVVKKNCEPIAVTDVHFAMIGSATPERFERMWQGTAGASGGLQSRFVLSYSEQVMPVFKTPNTDNAIQAARDRLSAVASQSRTVKLSGEAQDLIAAWVKDRATIPARVLDMAKRFALIVAAASDHDEITRTIMGAALLFAEYQIAVHEKFMPADSSGWNQAFENRIIRFFKRHPEACERDIRRSVSPEKFPGGYGAFQQALSNLIRSQKLVTDSKNRAGKPLWRLD